MSCFFSSLSVDADFDTSSFPPLSLPSRRTTPSLASSRPSPRPSPHPSTYLLSSLPRRPPQLWDVYREGKCLRTFSGHSKAVHDVTFNNSGSEFLSAAFDRQMKLWDTETGAFLLLLLPPSLSALLSRAAED